MTCLTVVVVFRVPSRLIWRLYHLSLSFEEGRSHLGITDSEYAPIRTASPTSFFVDAKAAGAKDMQMEMSIDALSVVTDSDPLLGLRGMLYGFSVLVWRLYRPSLILRRGTVPIFLRQLKVLARD